MGSMGASFVLKDEPVENLRPMKVRVIGAGYSGIYQGIRIPQRLQNIDLQIYEKNEDIGGTWWENRYPGCACDIPTHSYQYAFEPNPNWSGFYASSTEICEYLHAVAEKYGVRRFVKTNHKVLECLWDEAANKWKLKIEKTATGEVFDDDADIVVACKGNLNTPSWPKIEGIKNFKGEMMHSAAWNDSYDFENKRIGLIGGGSSSIQILPQLQKIKGSKISCFVRTKTWISNPFGDETMRKLGLDPQQLTFSEEQRKEFATNPEFYLKFRKIIESDGNDAHHATQKNSDMQNMFLNLFRDMMLERLAKKPSIIESLVPSFGVGCRRLTPGPGYLEALNEENVDFLSEEIACINSDGIKLESGMQVDLDVIVCATGFITSSAPVFPVIGKNGQTLEDKFKPYPPTYLALAVDDFPNFFMTLGPNAGIGAGSATVILEAQGDYIIKCMRKLQRDDYLSMVPKKARVQDFCDYVGQYFKKTIYMDDCKSWYKSEGGRGDRITALWPGSIAHCLETLRAPRWEDYEYESKDQNNLRWLGNGWSVCQLPGGGDPSYYLNPDFVDVPTAGTPETDPKYQFRPFYA